MQVIESSRLATPGEAAGPPAVVHADPTPFVRLPPAGTEHGTRYREAFGRRLAAARERRGIALEQIAQRMKVSTSLLAALERGDASRWPKGLFRRAFFRDYALAIGLPAEPYVTEFLHLFPDGEDHPTGPLPAPDKPTLRLAFEAAVGPSLTRAAVGAELLALVPVLLVALVVTLASRGGARTFIVTIALCYYGRVAAVVRRRIERRRRRAAAAAPGAGVPVSMQEGARRS
jgi:transcriptional regulator with XRE-family HTH domain